MSDFPTMNEFEIKDLQVGDRVSRKAWKAAAVVESIERGIGSGEDGLPELMTTKVVLRIGDDEEFRLPLEDLEADDWERIPDGHEKTQRWLKDSELTDWLTTGAMPENWSLPTNPPKTMGEICADRIREHAEGVNHYYMDLLYEQGAIVELCDSDMASKIFNLAKEKREKRDQS